MRHALEASGGGPMFALNALVQASPPPHHRLAVGIGRVRRGSRCRRCLQQTAVTRAGGNTLSHVRKPLDTSGCYDSRRRTSSSRIASRAGRCEGRIPTCARLRGAMPPIHPILVHFPVSLVTVSLGADVVGRLRPSAETRALGFWCLVVAVVGGAARRRRDLSTRTGPIWMRRRICSSICTATSDCCCSPRLALLAVWRWRIWRAAVPADRVGWP